MKTVFIKSGGYYETPGISVAGAIGDLHPYVSHYSKLDSQFTLDIVNQQYCLCLPGMGSNPQGMLMRVDFDFLTQQADEHGFAYIGVVSDARSNTVAPKEYARDMAVIVLDKATGVFTDAKSKTQLTGNNITALLYCVKMTDDTYAVIMSKMGTVNSRIGENRKLPVNQNFHLVVADDGDAIRHQFIDVQFKNTLKHFRNNDLVIGFAVFAKGGSTIELDIFRNAPFVTEEFKKNFAPEIDSNFSTAFDGTGRIFVTLPEEKMTGYLSVKLKATPLYEEIASREIKEMLSFDFIVSVL